MLPIGRSVVTLEGHYMKDGYDNTILNEIVRYLKALVYFGIV